MKTIVTLQGTPRPDNYTSHALAVVEATLRDRGVTVRRFDAREITLSFPGQPATEDARALGEAVEAASAVIVATPEYHGSFSAMTKLMIENLGFPSKLRDKPVGLLGVAAGRIGAIKSLEQLRGICAHVGAIALPQAISIAGVRKAFDADGTCRDEGAREALELLATNLIDHLETYVCPRIAMEAMAREGEATPWATGV